MLNKKVKFNICNIYILFWCMYMAQDFFGVRGIVAQGLLIINLIVSLYYMIYAIMKYKFSDYMKALTWFLFMLTCYGLVLILNGDKVYLNTGAPGFGIMVANSDYIKTILVSLLPIYPFYVFTRRGMITETSIRRWLYIFIFIITCHFFQMQRQYLFLVAETGIDHEEVTNNVGYMFLSLLPMAVFLYKKPMQLFLVLSYCILFLIMGMKRGAILIGVLAIGLILFRLSGGSGKYANKKYFIVTCLVLLIGYFVVMYYMTHSDYFISRLEKTMAGDSSARDVLYTTFYSHFVNNTDTWQFFFGSGALATLKVYGQYAHNDWLELAVNQGILGITIYMAYWLAANREWRTSDKNHISSLALMLVFLICFMKSLFSMSYGGMNYILTMTLGYCLAQNQMIKMSKRRKLRI